MGDMQAVSLERQVEPVDSSQVKPLNFILRTSESFEGLLSNVVTWSYLGISNITMVAVHKKDWGGKSGKAENKENRFLLH